MIGIHDHPGSFSDRWIEVCTSRRVPFRVIDCLATDAMQQSDGLDAVLWHWYHDDPSEPLVARQVIAALEQKGIIVFPNTATCAHFDDKIAQKYLLEAIGAPLALTWVFVNQDAAMQWIAGATWPKVFKLRVGAGSNNVRLVRSRKEAESVCRQAFGRGVPAVPGYFSDVHVRMRKTGTAADVLAAVRRAPETIARIVAMKRNLPRQVGYVYFQEFLAGNAGDTRITVIGNRAFGFQRLNRPGDFRASGSGLLVYEPEQIDRRCIELAFRVADRLGAQSLAFDFLNNAAGEPTIVEISYGYLPGAVHACAGSWDRDLNWHPGNVWPQDAILGDVLTAAGERDSAHVPCLSIEDRSLPTC